MQIVLQFSSTPKVEDVNLINFLVCKVKHLGLTKWYSSHIHNISLNMHAQLSSGAASLIFGLSLHLHLVNVYAKSTTLSYAGSVMHLAVFPTRGGDTGGIRLQTNPNPWELEYLNTGVKNYILHQGFLN